MPDRSELFISHKHVDKEIATTLADFIKVESGGRVRVHSSSNPDYGGPQIGGELNKQLQKALFDAGAVILIYTTEDRDWSYCMWECGVAVDANVPEPRIIVFQCGKYPPNIFRGKVRVNARELDDIQRFVEFFLIDADFFPGRGEAIAPGFEKQDAKKEAQKLFNSLQSVLPPLEVDVAEDWPTWPYLRVEMPAAHFDPEQADKYPLETLQDRIHRRGVVVDSDVNTPQLFGMASFPAEPTVGYIVDKWKQYTGASRAEWFESCCDQMGVGVRRDFPILSASPLMAVDRKAEHIPIVSRIRTVPAEGKLQFDIYFYNLSDPRGISVAKKMVPVDNIYLKHLSEIDPSKLALRDLLLEMSGEKRARVPFVDAEMRPVYIIHKSMVTDFMTQQMIDGKPVDNLTLADLLENAPLKEMFESTFAVVSESASIADARDAMRLVPKCQDVFVTANGSRDETIVGLLTNQDIAESI